MKEFSKLLEELEAWVVTARGSSEEILAGADLASAYMEYRAAPKPLILEPVEYTNLAMGERYLCSDSDFMSTLRECCYVRQGIAQPYEGTCYKLPETTDDEIL